MYTHVILKEGLKNILHLAPLVKCGTIVMYCCRKRTQIKDVTSTASLKSSTSFVLKNCIGKGPH